LPRTTATATPATDAARIVARTTDTVVVETSLSAPGWLVVREAHAEGWTASSTGDYAANTFPSNAPWGSSGRSDCRRAVTP
jgi:hypothetical protein